MSIERKANGKILARWREADGKQRARSFATVRDAKTFLATVTVDTMQGRYVAPDAGREVLGDYATRWAESQPWRPSTRERMVHVIDSQINPRWATTPIRSIRPSSVQAWVAEMTARGLAPSTVVSYFLVLASIMKAAKRDRLIVDSPTDDISLPRSERNASALVPLSVEQVHGIAEAIPDHYRALVLVSAGLGLRQGEACGLTVDRIDFLRKIVRIDRQLISPSGAGSVRFGPPKTPSSNRVITLPDSVLDVLAAHLSRHDEGPDRLVFTSSTGAPLRRSTWAKAYGIASAKIGVDNSPHALRHHCASVLISSGVSILAVSRFLGHKSATETLDTYGHLMPGDDDRLRCDRRSDVSECARSVHDPHGDGRRLGHSPWSVVWAMARRPISGIL